MNRIKFAGLIPLLLVFEGCAIDQPAGLITPDFGNAVQQNIAAETVNPDAPADRSPLTTDAQRAALAQGRYITDTVEKPEPVATQASQSGGGSGSNNGSAGGSAGTQ